MQFRLTFSSRRKGYSLVRSRYLFIAFLAFFRPSRVAHRDLTLSRPLIHLSTFSRGLRHHGL